MNCPQCNYPLNGLPAEHACPECGLKYDADSRVWYIRPPRFVIVFLSLAVGIPFLFSMFRITEITLRDRQFPLALCLLALALYGLMAGFFVWMIRRSRRSPTLLGIGPVGILGRTESGKFRLTPWQDIRKVSSMPMRLLAFHGVRIELASGRKARLATPFTRNESHEFVHAAQARLPPMEDGA